MSGTVFTLWITLLAGMMSTGGATPGVEPPSRSERVHIAVIQQFELFSQMSPSTDRSLADRSVEWPTWRQFARVLLLRDYNSRIVIFGTSLLGSAAGLVGSLMLLRRRALMGDAISHATLPGIGLAFIVSVSFGGTGKSLTMLLLGAAISGLIGVGAILLIRNLTRLKEDAALGIVLSVFFGAGTSLLGVIQQMESGHAAGLEAFIYGKTASMNAHDASLIAIVAGICVIGCVAFFKEFKLLCFDEPFAGSLGLPVIGLDILLMGLVVITTIVGLQAVGLILMIALLVIPAAAARFWTDRMSRMSIIAGAMGGLGGMVGAAMSALFSKLPSGAMIVLVCSAFFFTSMIIGLRRGVLIRLYRRWSLNRTIDHQHLLRAMDELSHPQSRHLEDKDGVTFDQLLGKRSWSRRQLWRAISRAEHGEQLNVISQDRIVLTDRGRLEAARRAHQHRLWEVYLTAYADVGPARIDRECDEIEHVLEPEVVAELETLLATQQEGRT